MRHARRSYNTIQDSSGRIPADEPVFVLRAKDRVAPVAIRIYADLVRAAGGSKELIEACELWSRQMETYAFSCYGGGKVPDADPSDFVTTPAPAEPEAAPAKEVQHLESSTKGSTLRTHKS